MAKVIVELPSSSLVVDAECVPALVQAFLGAEHSTGIYNSGKYLKQIKPLEDGMTITPLSDEHYKIYKIAGEGE